MPDTLARHTDELAHLLGPPPPNASEVLFFIFLSAVTVSPAIAPDPLTLPTPGPFDRISIALLATGCLLTLSGFALAAPAIPRTRETGMRLTQCGLILAAISSAAYAIIIRASIEPMTVFLCTLLSVGFLWRTTQINRSLDHHRRLVAAFIQVRADTERLVRLFGPPTP